MAKIDKFVKFVKMGRCATISPMVVASSPRGAAKRALCRVHDIKRSPEFTFRSYAVENPRRIRSVVLSPQHIPSQL